MSDQTIEFQAKIYVYDLKNCAREFGFKAGEDWEVGMATSEEKTSIENRYFPTLSASVLPEMLIEMFHSVKAKLTQQIVGLEKNLDTAAIRRNHLQYLIAYNPKRLRR
ncbi:hypothetical protein [Mucilaginibacter sp. SJ]|uniref:hypothetical protein n=1 Tax=Mucilaginibacter sp. SJ TaxID=3029053 RepID=UPI0023A9C03A|nr:hypothetical protein [Mucilaginibacter sp. SJ]WEA01667.1 hypothetical protein MusilaSJ_01865 [Mucilaginibacter sp. SJ]